MKIWDLDVKVDEYKNLAFVDKTQIKILLNQFDGRNMVDNWTPLEVNFIEDDRGLKTVDTACLFIGAPVINSKSLNVLNDLLIGTVEVLPLRHKTIDYYILNVMNVIDCLDLEKSEFKRFPDSEKIMWISKYVFLQES